MDTPPRGTSEPRVSEPDPDAANDMDAAPSVAGVGSRRRRASGRGRVCWGTPSTRRRIWMRRPAPQKSDRTAAEPPEGGVSVRVCPDAARPHSRDAGAAQNPGLPLHPRETSRVCVPTGGMSEGARNPPNDGRPGKANAENKYRPSKGNVTPRDRTGASRRRPDRGDRDQRFSPRGENAQPAGVRDHRDRVGRMPHLRRGVRAPDAQTEGCSRVGTTGKRWARRSAARQPRWTAAKTDVMPVKVLGRCSPANAGMNRLHPP